MATSESGNTMYPVSWKEYKDPETGLSESRKVAKGLTEQPDKFKETNGIDGKVYILCDCSLRERIIAAHYDTPLAEHPEDR